MTEKQKLSTQLIFGLDIGTRSIVGTVGYKVKDEFYVVAQKVKEHETRAMLDGQIHDIEKVAESIRHVKKQLEEEVGQPLTEACIAAAGRVLKTINIHAQYDLNGEKSITEEDLFALNSLGVENAYEEFAKQNNTEEKFYCVGYTVIRYFTNNHQISKPVGHKASIISADFIATFLPDDVVDGLYKAVESAGLAVANLTLEPIAAIQVAIPDMYRMLNIALIDVGAGTSDISITKDGSIIAYGMLPTAGDGLTEAIAQFCLVDFNTAERIKKEITENEAVEYLDIMGLSQTVTNNQIATVLLPTIKDMAKQAADKMKELNGSKPVSAVFIVGGGGKIAGYAEMLAEELGIQKERVALRGEEVMGKIHFMDTSIKKDSLLVTPVGICLSFYEQSNNFIFVSFNGKRIKLYDNSKLAIVDAAMQSDFPSDGLFPRRGEELSFTINGKTRITRGQLGEAAIITLNGKEADIHTPIHANDVIVVTESSKGKPASLEIMQLPEYQASIFVYVNDQKVVLPKFAEVNQTLQSGYYDIKNDDIIEIVNFYTVKQVADFMDIMIESHMNVYVNNKPAGLDEKVYENFSISFDSSLKEDIYSEDEPEPVQGLKQDPEQSSEQERKADSLREESVKNHVPGPIRVIVNGLPVLMNDKAVYVYVDIFEYIKFDLTASQGRLIVTTLNGRAAQYMEPVQNGDVIEIYWKG